MNGVKLQELAGYLTSDCLEVKRFENFSAHKALFLGLCDMWHHPQSIGSHSLKLLSKELTLVAYDPVFIPNMLIVQIIFRDKNQVSILRNAAFKKMLRRFSSSKYDNK